MNFEGSRFYDDDSVFGAYSRLRERTGSANDTLERPVILELLGEVGGHDFLDLGCGDAGFGKELLATGAASYLGVDGSQNMITQAGKTLEGTIGRVVRSELDEWTYPVASCSRVCARLSLHYVSNIGPLFQKIHRTLRPGGRFVFSVEHPVITSCDLSCDDVDTGQNWVVDNYFNRGKRVTRWLGANVVKYHRTVEDYFLALQAAGFTVESVRESNPVRSNFRSDETFVRRLRIPLFLFMAGVSRRNISNPTKG